ncbi:MAG: universal stress protein, partial [Bdellovibrionales bacterium]|nr:universal stress protein [Bdellovibrionales bacterium]
MKRLLVTTDLSELSKFAFATAKELADSLNAGIVLLYIVEHEALLVAPPYGYIPVDIIREHE